MEKPCAALVAPSRTYVTDEDAGVLDLERLSACVTGLETLGFRVKRNEFRNFRRYGGTLEERLEELNRASLDPETDIVCPVRGGYGMVKLLSGVRFSEIKERPPVFMGFSDFTAFNCALYAETGLASWQGPMAGGLAPGYGAPESRIAFLRALTESHWEAELDPAFVPETEGTVWGGNLAMICSLAGTKWLPGIEGGILCLEDVGEVPYRIDRMLWQLAESGVLYRQKAVVFGEFTGASRGVFGEADLRFRDVLSEVRENLVKRGVVVASGLRFGHTKKLSAFPFGVPGRIGTGSGGRLTMSSDTVPLIGRGREALRSKLSELTSSGN